MAKRSTFSRKSEHKGGANPDGEIRLFNKQGKKLWVRMRDTEFSDYECVTGNIMILYIKKLRTQTPDACSQ